MAPGGLVAIRFTSARDRALAELFGAKTSLDFVLHQPDAVIAALTDAGFTLEARLERAPYPDVEYPSQRTYLRARAW